MPVVSPPGSCAEEGCDRVAVAMGMCNRCWMRRNRKDASGHRISHKSRRAAEPVLQAIIGPVPCQRCRAKVVYVKVGGVRIWVSQLTGRKHVCDELPPDWSWSWLVSEYGEEEALRRLGNLPARSLSYEEERQRRYQREYQRKRRADRAVA